MNLVTAKRRILLVDDELTIAETLALVFASGGYEVRVAWSAEQAVDTIANWQPDLAVLDVMLPQMNGIDLAFVITENYPACQILLVSGHPAAAELLKAAGARGRTFEILGKPVHPALILASVARILAGAEGADA